MQVHATIVDGIVLRGSLAILNMYKGDIPRTQGSRCLQAHPLRDGPVRGVRGDLGEGRSLDPGPIL